MKNSKYIFIIIILLIVIGLIVYFYVSNNQVSNSNTTKPKASDQLNSELINEIENEKETENEKDNKIENAPPQETPLSSFATEIKDNSSGRLANIRITCDIINGTVLGPGQTFSFNEIVGQPSSKRGYQEATVIIDGEHETGIGGGNCQVSSTLYNAVLAVPTLEVVERHEHGGSGVTYVPYGKDAAVSYSSSLDLKFKNNNDYKVKINLSSDDKNITATLLKIED